jgi:hypothetical protein
MKKLVIVLTIMFVLSISAFIQMGYGQGGSMMGNDHGGGMMGVSWGWGVNYGWLFLIIIAILVIFGIVYMTKQK